MREINEKCSELQKQENRVRKCLKKLSAGSSSKKDTDNESQRTTSSKDKENIEYHKGSYEDENYLQDIDYNRIIKNAMKRSDSDQSIKKSSKSIISNNRNDRDIIDVDAICRIDEGILITQKYKVTYMLCYI